MNYVQHTRINRDEVYKAVTKGKPEKMLRKYYHYLTSDHKEQYYNNLLEWTVDRYIHHRDHKNNINLCYDDRKAIGQAAAVIDGIELLIDQFNYDAQENEEWKK